MINKMTIDKAMQILKLNISLSKYKMPPDVLTALKMSASGLQQIKLWRQHGYPQFMPLLEGETEQ